MKYIKNTGRMALAFTIVNNDREVKISLDRRRLYNDTGNIASDGITPVAEEDIKELEKQKLFNAFVEKGELTILDEAEVRTPDENKIKKLEETNKELENKIRELEKEPSAKAKKEAEKALKDKDDEIKSLKEQLEALTKNKTAEAAGDSEGF